MINDAVDIVWQNGRDFAGFILNGFHREWLQGAGSGAYGGGYGYGKSTEGRGAGVWKTREELAG